MIFSKITQDLQNALKSDLAQIRFMVKKNPGMAYTKIVDIGTKVGQKYNIKLVVNFPHEGKIEQYDYYGKRDLSLIIDQEKTRFPIDREKIKEKAKEIFGNVNVEDAYMYEGKEGVRVYSPGGKIDILPHSLHVWTFFDDNVTKFCDWLMETVYEMKEV